MKNSNGKGSMIFTISYGIILLILLVGVCIYVGGAKEFIQPIMVKVDGDSFDYTLDEFAAYMLENGYISTGDYSSVEIDGITEARNYGGKILSYVAKDSDEYDVWKQKVNVGNATYGDGTFNVVYGQFAASWGEAEDTSSLVEILQGFPLTFSGNHGNKTVWECTYEEFEEYMTAAGFFNPDEKKKMTTIGTINYIYNGIDTIWWDVDNLDEDSEEYENWEALNEDGFMMFAGTVYMPILNGPFGIYVTAACPFKAEDVIEVFEAFPRGL